MAIRPGYLSIVQAGSVNRTGLHLSSNCLNAQVRNCTATGFSDAGFRFDGFGSNDPQPMYQTTKFFNCSATYCWQGVNFINSAEYMTPVNFVSANCGEGMEIDSGNDLVNGGQDTRDGVGIAVFGGINPAHSTVANRTINHCYIGAYCNGFNNGENFLGCNLEGGVRGHPHHQLRRSDHRGPHDFAGRKHLSAGLRL